jgi:hypothetical protein
MLCSAFPREAVRKIIIPWIYMAGMKLTTDEFHMLDITLGIAESLSFPNVRLQREYVSISDV